MVSWAVGAQAMRHWRGSRRAQYSSLYVVARKRLFLTGAWCWCPCFSLFFFPAATLQLYKGARAVGEALLSGAWPAQYEPVLRALADERLLVYMGFVLATRITIGLLVLLGSKWIGTKPAREEFPL